MKNLFKVIERIFLVVMITSLIFFSVRLWYIPSSDKKPIFAIFVTFLFAYFFLFVFLLRKFYQTLNSGFRTASLSMGGIYVSFLFYLLLKYIGNT